MHIEVPQELLEGAANELKNQIKQLVEKERSVDGYTDNAEELAATNQVFDNMVVNVFVADNSIHASLEMPDLYWAGVMQEGTEPIIGGDNGMATDPFGNKYHSQAPPSTWGKPATWWNTAANMWYENVMTQAKTMGPGIIKDYISSNMDMLAEPVKKVISEYLKNSAGGQ